MTAKNNKKQNKKMEQTLGAKTNDDYQVIIDDRGFYKVGNWFVRIRRINVREMIAAWGVVSQAFQNVQSIQFDWSKASTWISLFLTALPYVPGKFYQFLQQVMELQNDSHQADKEFYGKETDKYNKYIRSELKTEELIDVITVMYNQEKDRFSELAKQADFILGPLIKSMQAEPPKNPEAEKILKNIGKESSI